MKKSTRFITLALALILLVSVLPMSAMAAKQPTPLGYFLMFPFNAIYDSQYSYMDDPIYAELEQPLPIGEKEIVLQTSPNDQITWYDGKPYEVIGYRLNPTQPDKIQAVHAHDKLVIPPCPDETADPEGAKKWKETYVSGTITETLPNNDTMDIPVTTVVTVLAPHKHNTGNYSWSYDANNHWKYCTRCAAFVYLNWHSDVDCNGICDVCKQKIVYRKLSVLPSEGGKITLSADKGTVGNRIAVTVTPDPGYKLAELKAHNDNGKDYSNRAIFEDVKGSQYHFILDVWDVEVSAKFVKE